MSRNRLTREFEQIVAGSWRERGEGVARGPKYNLELLAQAIVDLATDRKKAQPVDFYAEKLKSDRSFAAKVRARTAIMARYYELAGAGEENSDSLL